jgi:GH25 family lysozyme M1 (1,4-beta-N-acetylmuramidase)
MNLHDLESSINTFRDELKKAGYDTMLYSSKWYLEHVWPNEDEYPVWLAHYTSNTNYQGKYILWQKTNEGKIDGISGDVDIDIYYMQ